MQKVFTGLDDLDEGILRALYANGRASWSRIAQEVGSSASTVRRRFEVLHQNGHIRVVGRTDVARLGLGIPVMVQFHGRESSRPDLMRTLQRRSDVRFVSAVIGSTGCIAEIVSHSLVALQSAIHEITLMFDVSAEPFVVMHTYTSGQDWMPDASKRDIDLDPGKIETDLSQEERVIVGKLLLDGRTSLGELAASINKSESTARRILESLQERDIVSFRVLVEPQLLGFQSTFWVWLNVRPSHLAAVGKILAANPATKTLFATAGRFNLVGQFVLPHHSDAYSFMANDLGHLDGLHGAEMMLQTTTYKRVWNMLEDQSYVGVVGPDWLFGQSCTDIEN